MRKKILICLFVTLISVFSFSINPITSESSTKKDIWVQTMLLEYNSKGDIKNYSVFDYDMYGNKIKHSSYDKRNKLYRYSKFEYNSNGELIKRSLLKGNDDLIIYMTYQYNKDGDLIKETTYNKRNRTAGTKIFTYNNKTSSLMPSQYILPTEKNSSKRIIKEVTLDERGDLKSYYTYKYNRDGFLERYNHYHKDNTLVKSVKYEYNGKKQLIRETAYDSEWTVKSSIKYEYDKNGYVSRLKRYNNHNKLVHYNVYSHNKSGQLDTYYSYNGHGQKMSKNLYKWKKITVTVLE